MDLAEGKHFLYMLGAEQYVDKYYIPNNETETLLFDGREIRPGMVIVSAEEGIRESLDMSKVHRLDFDHIQRRIASNNRWFYVLRAEIVKEEVYLLVLHQDGSIAKKKNMTSESWLVKNESLCKCVACKPVHYRDGLVWGFDPYEKIDSETKIDYNTYKYLATDFVEEYIPDICAEGAPSLLCTSTAGDALDGGTTHRCKLPSSDHTWHVAQSGRRWRAVKINEPYIDEKQNDSKVD